MEGMFAVLETRLQHALGNPGEGVDFLAGEYRQPVRDDLIAFAKHLFADGFAIAGQEKRARSPIGPMPAPLDQPIGNEAIDQSNRARVRQSHPCRQ